MPRKNPVPPRKRRRKVTFGDIRRLLSEYGFVQLPGDGKAVVFEHKRTNTLLFFRPHRLKERADAFYLAMVEKMLDERAILERDEFEDALRQASPEATSKSKRKE